MQRVANWRSLQDALGKMSEGELLQLLKKEIRQSYRSRIYGRYSRLRAEREKREYGIGH